MKKKKSRRTIQFLCPFCKEIIVEACDHSAKPDDISDKQWENITCCEEGDDRTDGRCEHLAFWSDWAYAGSYVEEAWAPQVELIAKAFRKNECAEDEYEEDEKIDVEDTVASSLLEVFHDGDISEDGALKIMCQAVEDVDIALDGGYVEKYNGITGGGPTYMMIFMRKKSSEQNC